jgi:hypothetical protein
MRLQHTAQCPLYRTQRTIEHVHVLGRLLSPVLDIEHPGLVVGAVRDRHELAVSAGVREPGLQVEFAVGGVVELPGDDLDYLEGEF